MTDTNEFVERVLAVMGNRGPSYRVPMSTEGWRRVYCPKPLRWRPLAKKHVKR